MFYVIGLGLGGAEDITVRGLEIVKKAERVYLESYTSILTVGKELLVRLCLRFMEEFLLKVIGKNAK
jgi:diphthamide biosynthesis methyltransferase